jgi:hypothetical protein
MSESSEDQSKRTYIAHLHSKEWAYQYTVFYKSLADSKEACNHSADLKRSFRRNLKVPLLYRLQLRGGLDPKLFTDVTGTKRVTAAYHTFLSVEKLDEARLEKLAGNATECDIKVRGRPVNQDKLGSIERTVKKQKPHDFNTFFGKSNIHRFRLLNSDK